MARSAIWAAGVAAALAASPVPGFRPPAIPIINQSPLISAWSTGNNLYDTATTFWQGAQLDFFAAARVDGSFYLLMGAPNAPWAPSGTLATATQTSVTVMSTQTIVTYQAGPVAINMTFTSPQIPGDWDLMSRPAHYITWSARATDAAPRGHSVQLYLDVNANIVVRDGSQLVSWARHDLGAQGIDAEALSIGPAAQNPLQDTNDRASWGVVYLVRDTSAGSGSAAALEYSNTTRLSFLTTGTLPSADAGGQPAPLLPQGPALPGTGPQIGVDRPGFDMPGSPFSLPSADYNLCWAQCNKTAGCKAWAYAVPNCDGYPQPTCWLKGDYPGTADEKCRVSGQQPGQPSYTGLPLAAAITYDLGAVTSTAAVSRYAVFSVDEILSIEYFGESLPPYWRRALPVNSTDVVPTGMLGEAWASYASTKTLCDEFDAKQAQLLSAVGGDEYATLAQLTYRQVFAGLQIVYWPSRNQALYFLKEISSCGCLQTADVLYPAFPQLLYFSPELTRLSLIPHLEYAMNRTSQPYPLPWAPHHLGFWPIADLPYTNQENMPLEETAWMMLQIASIAQRQGGDVTWLEPYWPAIQQWYDFLVTLLPFPGLQLSTDDFDGQLYNATNLAVKGVAAIAAYGYILEQYTGNATAGADAYAIAAEYAGVMTQYAWLKNNTHPEQSHFMIGYAGSQGDGGVPTSWPMLYNALWLRILGYDDLVEPSLLAQQAQWYQANVMQEFGVPLNSRKLYTKDDWMTFLAAYYFNADGTPSAFSSQLFSRFYAWANTTTSRQPISDWTWTNSPDAVGFSNRPVYGAMYAPVLVAQAQQLGLGRNGSAKDSAERANAIFRRVRAEQAAKAGAAAAL